MIDYKPTLVAALATILPTSYELFVSRETTTPCITYIENDNYSTLKGNTIGYSELSYTIKIWGKELDTLMTKALLVDTKMNDLGFTRTAYRELAADDMICLIMTYDGTGQEGTQAWN